MVKQQKTISTITSKLGSQPSLNNYQFNFNNNLFHLYKFQEKKTNKIP